MEKEMLRPPRKPRPPRKRRIRVYKPSLPGQPPQPGTVDWELMRRDARRRDREEQKAEKEWRSNAAIFGGNREASEPKHFDDYDGPAHTMVRPLIRFLDWVWCLLTGQHAN